uniref:Uncharacterized protein n=1 Tax=Pipistrellus kuhlii TaxID=59472 RepID=A0A7J7ZIW5_PIPKU|nr:hypothetical protein mPipKuh1_009439 [Pipistrellus kuhlii]
MRGEQERSCGEVFFSHSRVPGLEGRQWEGAGCFILTLGGSILSHTHTSHQRGPGLGFLWEPCSPSSYQLPWIGHQPFATSPSGAHFTTVAFGPKLGGTCPHPFSPTPASLPDPCLPSQLLQSLYHPPPSWEVCRGASGCRGAEGCTGLTERPGELLCAPSHLVSFWPTSPWSQLFAGLLPQKQRVGCRSQE